MKNKKIKILFVCNGNRVRSLMAQEIVRKTAEKLDLPIEVESAGIDEANARAKVRPWVETLEVLRENSIDASSHVPRHVDEVGDLSRFDLIVAMEPAVDAYLVGTYGLPEDKVIALNITDPGPNLEKNRQCLAEIAKEVAQILDSVRQQYEAEE